MAGYWQGHVPSVRGDSRIFLMGWHGGGQDPVGGAVMGKVMCPNTSGMT